MMSSSASDPRYYDTDGRPDEAAAAAAERKLKVWAVLSAVSQGLMNAAEACAAYAVSPHELDEHRASWLELAAGR